MLSVKVEFSTMFSCTDPVRTRPLTNINPESCTGLPPDIDHITTTTSFPTSHGTVITVICDPASGAQLRGKYCLNIFLVQKLKIVCAVWTTSWFQFRNRVWRWSHWWDTQCLKPLSSASWINAKISRALNHVIYFRWQYHNVWWYNFFYVWRETTL